MSDRAITDPPTSAGAVVADKDVARTFAESDLALTVDDCGISAESVALSFTGQPTNRTDDDASTSDTAKHGVTINPNGPLVGVEATISANSSGFTTAYIYETSTGNLITSKDISGKAAGDTVRLDGVSLSEGTDYNLVMDDGGNSWTVGRDESDNSFPYTGRHLDIVDAAYNSTGSNLYAAAYTDVAGIGDNSTGTVYVEWDPADTAPKDAVGWDVAYFTRTLDSEAVDVYAEEAQGSPGWTEVAGPMARGDSIPADPSNDVRFRVELSRADTANNPTLDSILRRWKL